MIDIECGESLSMAVRDQHKVACVVCCCDDLGDGTAKVLVQYLPTYDEHGEVDTLGGDFGEYVICLDKE